MPEDVVSPLPWRSGAHQDSRANFTERGIAKSCGECCCANIEGSLRAANLLARGFRPIRMQEYSGSPPRMDIHVDFRMYVAAGITLLHFWRRLWVTEREKEEARVLYRIAYTLLIVRARERVLTIVVR